MLSPLLQTKLYIPALRPQLVPRPRLLSRIGQAGAFPCTLISAPAGFGKTTLLAEWIVASETQAAWLSLDESDNDPIRFWSYAAAALETAQAGLGISALTLLQAPQSPPLEAVLTVLINTVAAFRQDVVLVLDDYHVIANAAIHAALKFLLKHLPPNLHLVMTTRSDPPLPLAQLRARGQLLELRTGDLRFTNEEAAAFLNEVMKLGLGARDVAALEARTEGWIAGLQLAALSMQGRRDTAGFIAAFTGSNQYIISYLGEEVLERQSEAIQDFLLRTCILERMNAGLCNAVTGREDSGKALEQLEESNLFLIPLDDMQDWYRYHRLFADVLQRHLQKTLPALVPELHRRASQWFEDHELAAEAIEHALAAEDWTRTTRLIQVNGDALLKRGETSTIQQWLDALPEGFVRSQPRLCLLRAELYGLAHQLERAEEFLQDAERGARTDTFEEGNERASILTQVRFLRTSLALNAGDLNRTIVLAREALENLPSEDARMRGWLLLRLGTALLQISELAAGSAALAEASQLSWEVGDSLTFVYAMDNLAGACGLEAQLSEAAQLYQQTLDALAARGSSRVPITSLIHADFAEVLYEWNDLEGARHHLADALELGKLGGLPRSLVNAYVQLVQVLIAQDDLPGARAALEQAKQRVEQYKLPLFFSIPTRACEVRLRLAEGNVEAAASQVRQSGLSVDDPLSQLEEGLHLMFVRVLCARGEAESALKLLARLEEAAEEAGRTGNRIEILGLQALARYQRGEKDAALTTLARALVLAEPEGYIRTFIDEGKPMRFLISDFERELRANPQRWAQLASAGDGSPHAPRRALSVTAQKGQIEERVDAAETGRRLLEYVERLLAAFPAAPPLPVLTPESAKPNAAALREPLSAREMEVLRLVATGLSDREVGVKLFLATGTVKKHLNNIYGKLQVNSRTQALARAKELGLI